MPWANEDELESERENECWWTKWYEQNENDVINSSSLRRQMQLEKMIKQRWPNSANAPSSPRSFD